VRGLPCPFCPGCKAFAEEKAGIDAKRRKKHKKMNRLKFNEWMIEGGVRDATKIMWEIFRLWFFLRLLRLLRLLHLPLFVLAVACRAIRHSGAQPALIVPCVDGGLGVPGVYTCFHRKLFGSEFVHIGLFCVHL
jgi:hypothetical protein